MTISRQCYTHTASETPEERDRAGRFATFADLTKLKLTSMASLSAALAWVAASSGKGGIFDLFLLFISVLASASGAAALNEWSERQIDSKMNRTQRRPLPSRQIDPKNALRLGLSMVSGGTLFLAFYFNLLAGLLALAAAVVYWLVYTPLKKKTPWCTEVGAISGALPPLIGWAAAAGTLNGHAWTFFGILFLWQMPHFHPISWRYREDYRAAGLKMRVVTESSGDQAALHAVLYAAVLNVSTFIVFLATAASAPVLVISLIFGTLYLATALQFRFSENRNAAAKSLFRFSLIYLPAILTALTSHVIR